MIIRPDINTTPDHPIVKFRESKEVISLNKEIPKLLASQGWGLGTIFTVQFVNHEKTELIKTTRFIVTSEHSDLKTFNPDSQSPNTKMVEQRQAKQMEPWFYPNGSPAERMEIDWNFGEKKHRVMLDGEVIARFDKKPQAEEFIKEAA